MIRLGYSKEYKEDVTLGTKESSLDCLYKQAVENIENIYEAVRTNLENGMFVYEIYSEIFPHITNYSYINSDDYTKLAYDISGFDELLSYLGGFISKAEQIIYFHPKYLSLGSKDEGTLVSNMRILYFYSLLIRKMELENAYIVMEIGGIYGSKKESMTNWMNNFNYLSYDIKKYIVIENDVKNYCMRDIIKISRSVKNFSNLRCKYKIPILFNYDNYLNYMSIDINKPISFNSIISDVIKSWKEKSSKICIIQRNRYYLSTDQVIKKLPDIIKNIPQKYNVDVDILVRVDIKHESFDSPKKKYSL